MIVAVGLDLVELSRIKKIWQKHPKRFLYRHFTSEEIIFCRSKVDPLPSIAARIAAKAVRTSTDSVLNADVRGVVASFLA